MARFTNEEDEFLSMNYLTVPAKRMAKILGRSEGTARKRMKLLGIVVPLDIIHEFRKASQIKVGSIPMNKGKKQAEYMGPKSIELCRATQFKKGQVPPNTKSDFTITIRADNRGIKYQFIRISLGKWVGLHRFVWQLANGPIPPNHNIFFKDKNTLNCNLDNLEILSNAELLRRNSLHNYPKELAVVIQLRGVLNRQIKKHLKKIGNKTK